MAVLVGKSFRVAGVVQLGGVVDKTWDADPKPAPWLSNPSATPPKRIYGSAHDADILAEVGLTWPVLQMDGSSYVDSECRSGPMLHSKNPAHTCINAQNCDAHYMPLLARYSSVWTYMLTRQLDTVIPHSSSSSAGGSVAAGTGVHVSMYTCIHVCMFTVHSFPSRGSL